MNTSFTWDILSLKKYPQVGVNTNVVYQAKWRVTGICTVGSETKTAYVEGIAGFSTDSYAIAYENLDANTVIGWTKDSLLPLGVAGYEKQVSNLLNSDEYDSTPPWE